MDASFLCGLAAGAVAFGFYVATLLPGVAFWDTGEMQTVPYVLGIAHPTGFPLFVLGGWLFSHALPLGSPAWRLSLFSALASAAGAGAGAALVVELGAGVTAGFCAALAFALGDVAWTRAVRAEVHDLVVLFTALAFFWAVRAARRRSPGALMASGLASGLGLATHPVVALALPGVVLAAWPALAAVPHRVLVACVVLGCAPLALYAYVPLRSAYVEAHALDPTAALGVTGGAFWDDDAPSSSATFVRYLAGSSFDAGDSLARSLSPAGFPAALAFGAGLAYREYGELSLALALCGLVSLGARQPLLAVGFVATVALGVSFGANYAVEADRARYALTALWLVAVGAGVGASWVAKALAGGQRPRLAALVAGAILVGGLSETFAASRADVGRERRLSDARSFTAAVEDLIVPGSLVVASWTFAAPLAYDAYVTGALRARLICAWPERYVDRYAAWHARYGHVYFVVSPVHDVAALGRRLVVTSRYAIAEWRP